MDFWHARWGFHIIRWLMKNLLGTISYDPFNPLWPKTEHNEEKAAVKTLFYFSEVSFFNFQTVKGEKEKVTAYNTPTHIRLIV